MLSAERKKPLAKAREHSSTRRREAWPAPIPPALIETAKHGIFLERSGEILVNLLYDSR